MATMLGDGPPGTVRRSAAAGHPPAAVDLQADGQSDRVDGPFDFGTFAAAGCAVHDTPDGVEITG